MTTSCDNHTYRQILLLIKVMTSHEKIVIPSVNHHWGSQESSNADVGLGLALMRPSTWQLLWFLLFIISLVGTGSTGYTVGLVDSELKPNPLSLGISLVSGVNIISVIHCTLYRRRWLRADRDVPHKAHSFPHSNSKRVQSPSPDRRL